MFKRPMVGIAICMAVGIFVGYAAGLPLKLAYIGFFVFAIGSLMSWIVEKQAEKGITFIFIYLSVFFLGITLFQGKTQYLSHHPLANSLKGKTLSIRGTICAFPRKFISSGANLMFWRFSFRRCDGFQAANSFLNRSATV